MASAFLGKYALVTEVDLIQLKKLNSLQKRVGTLMNSNSIFNLVASFRYMRYTVGLCRYY